MSGQPYASASEHRENGRGHRELVKRDKLGTKSLFSWVMKIQILKLNNIIVVLFVIRHQ